MILKKGKKKLWKQANDSLAVEQALRMDFFSPLGLMRGVLPHSSSVTCPFWSCEHSHTFRTRTDRPAFRIREGYCLRYWQRQQHGLIGQATWPQRSATGSCWQQPFHSSAQEGKQVRELPWAGSAPPSGGSSNRFLSLGRERGENCIFLRANKTEIS